MLMQRVKPLARILAEGSDEKRGLKRSLGPWALTAMGIGAIIGTGIFVLTGVGSATRAGPALTISFVIAGIVSALAALCYAEVSSKVPISGSAYTYTYSTLGEFFAWIVGWALVLEYALGASTVSVGWSGYFTFILHTLFNWNIPQAWQHSHWDPTPGIANLPAAAIILLVTALLVKGTRESGNVNAIIVAIKVLIVLFFIAIGVGHIDPANYHLAAGPLTAAGGYFPFGWTGVLGGAAFMFFAYIGFDAVSTTAEEAKNPAKDLPFGIIMSLVICTVLYIVVVAILDGIVPFYKLNVTFPVTFAMNYVNVAWAGVVIAFGAIAGLTTVLLVMMYGQTRIFYAMSRDGLIPALFVQLHPTWRTPWLSQILFGILIAAAGAFFPIGVLGSLTNMGTFLAFILVACSVPLLRNRHPELKGTFTLPFGPYIIPALAGLSALVMMYYLKYGNPVVWGVPIAWLGFIIWFAAGLIFYFSYGRHKSTIALEQQGIDRPSRQRQLAVWLPATLALIVFIWGVVNLATRTSTFEKGLAIVAMLTSVAAGAYFLYRGVRAAAARASVEQVRREFIGSLQSSLTDIGSLESPELQSDIRQLQELRATDRLSTLERHKTIVQDQLFQVNRLAAFQVMSLRCSNVQYFGDFVWPLARDFNLLLGRNGYGKSYLLHGLAGLLADRYTDLANLFPDESLRAEIAAVIEKRSVLSTDVAATLNEVIFTADGLRTTLGPIPVLAIPDIRSMDKSDTKLGLSAKTDMVRDGATFFLREQPVEALVESMLYQLCLDYLEHSQIRLPSIAMLERVITELSESEFRFEKIKRSGPANFEILVVAEGLSERPMPLQRASQGTLSTVAMFGLIERFLRQINPVPPIVDVTARRAIVIIDELDAHLHPSWQRKIVSLLRDVFPNVQFIVSAHSPLLVAGRFENQVAVLRKSEDGRFVVHPYPQDFIGEDIASIITHVFDAEAEDQSFQFYIAQQPIEASLRETAKRLEETSDRSEEQQERLEGTVMEIDRIQRADERKQQRMRRDDLEQYCTVLENQNRMLRAELRELRPPEPSTSESSQENEAAILSSNPDE